MSEINRVGIVGCGLMGSGITDVCSRAGLDVIVSETNPEAVAAGRTRVASSFDKAVARGKLSRDEADRVLGRIRFTVDLDSLFDRDLVIEAVVESEEVKCDVFRRLDAVLDDDDALLASNTSSIPIMKLGMATRRPENVIGVHFFNPVPILELVELVPSLLTSQKTEDRSTQFVEETLRKSVIRSEDRAGFVVNALLIPYLLSSIRMLESGFASAADIDKGMVLGCAHPMGPLALADLIGLDTVNAIAESMHEEFKEPLFAPPPVLMRMVDAGLFGRKSGRGFFHYVR